MQWNRLPRKVVESPLSLSLTFSLLQSLEIFKGCMDVVLRNMASGDWAVLLLP